MHTYECVDLEVTDHIATVTLSRPEKRNTMTLAFFKEIMSIFETLDADETVRVVLIKAQGKSFTAGLDLMEAASFWQEPSARSRHALRATIMELQRSFTAIERCRKPVLCAIHSHCIGGGVDLAAACDIRAASKDAVFSIRETRMAMVADLGTLQRISSIIGHGWARYLALTGRDFDAALALKIGFVTEVYENSQALHQGMHGLAREIAALSPLAVQGVKETMNFSRDYGVAAGLEYVAQKNAALLPSEDLMEAFKAFVEKRPPCYTGT